MLEEFLIKALHIIQHSHLGYLYSILFVGIIAIGLNFLIANCIEVFHFFYFSYWFLVP